MTINLYEGEEDGKRRDRHEIIVEILRTAIEGRVKTHIMYKARLSYAQLNEYLPRLVEKGFLENRTVTKRRVSQKVFKTTSKGLQLLESFENIDSLWLPKNGNNGI